MKRWIPLLPLAVALLAGCRSDTVWSPDSRQLAVTARGLLFTFDLAGRRFQQRSLGPAKALNAAWTPDGKRLVYYRAAVKQSDVSALDLMAFDPATGRNSVLIPKVPAPGAAPPPAGANGGEGPIQINLNARLDAARELLTTAWSRDGSRVAYVAYAGLDAVLWVANGDGSGARLLLPEGQHAFRPSWSPDGSRIAYVGMAAEVSHPAEADAAGQSAPPQTLEIVSADGSGHRVLWETSRKERLAPLGPEPQWSADGKSLLVFVDVPKSGAAPGAPGAPGEAPGQAVGPGPSETCELWSVPLDGEPARLGAVPGPSPFVTLAAGRVGFFYTPKPMEESPRLGLLSPPYGEARLVLQITQQMFGQKPGQKDNVDTIPVPALSPDGKWVALAVVPEKGTARLGLFPTAGGAAQVYPIPLPAPPPAPGVKKPAVKGKARGGKR